MNHLMLKDQKGVALILALLMLLVLTFIGITSIGSTIFETKISGNERVGSAAFYTAEGGLDVGLDRLPDTTAYSGNLGNGETYRSGRMTPSSPQDLIKLGMMIKSGYDNAWEFKRFQVNATGESSGAVKEIEAQVSFGPFSTGTQYNN